MVVVWKCCCGLLVSLKTTLLTETLTSAWTTGSKNTPVTWHCKIVSSQGFATESNAFIATEVYKTGDKMTILWKNTRNGIRPVSSSFNKRVLNSFTTSSRAFRISTEEGGKLYVIAFLPKLQKRHSTYRQAFKGNMSVISGNLYPSKNYQSLKKQYTPF